jgi:DNA-binding response OmpR family regulator
MLYHLDYDLIILDLSLPSIEGHIICRRIREIGISTPVLVLTAKADVSSKIELLHRGADDYLSKPFSLEELEARINAILRRPRATLSETLRVGEVELNLTERSVRHYDTLLNLTLKEFALLEYFLRNKNKVISRDELLSHVWDFNYTSFFSNAVDVHVKNLRKKLKDEDGRLIHTVHGVGYRLVEPEHSLQDTVENIQKQTDTTKTRNSILTTV